MKTNVARLLAAVALFSIPAALSAHRMWLLPSGTVFSGSDAWVTVDAAVSNDLFYADHQPGRLEPMTVTQPDGTPGRLQNGSTGSPTAAAASSNSPQRPRNMSEYLRRRLVRRLD